MAELKDILNPGADPEIHAMKIGTGANYSEIQADGSIMYYGDATMWEDITGSLIASRLVSTSGKLDYNYDNNTITMQPGGNPASASDRLIFNFQKPHSAKLDSEFRLHMHWEQVSTDAVVWQIDYRIQHNNQAKTTAWVTTTAGAATDNVFTYPGSGTFNQITRLVNVDLSEAALSSTVQFRVTRTDTTADDVEVVFVDAHFEKNADGSRNEFVK